MEENEENDEEEKKQYNSYISCYTCRLNKGQHMAKILLLLWRAEVLYFLAIFIFNKLQNQKLNEKPYLFNMKNSCWTGV